MRHILQQNMLHKNLDKNYYIRNKVWCLFYKYVGQVVIRGKKIKPFALFLAFFIVILYKYQDVSEKMKIVIKVQPCLAEAFWPNLLSCFTKISVLSGEMAFSDQQNIKKKNSNIFDLWSSTEAWRAKQHCPTSSAFITCKRNHF